MVKPPAVKSLQLDSIDTDLKNSLWNLYKGIILDSILDTERNQYSFNKYRIFSRSLWHHFFKLPINEIPSDRSNFYLWLYNWFFKYNREWFEIYDLLDFSFSLIQAEQYEISIKETQAIFNSILEREFSAYRFIEGQLCPISNEIEATSLEDCIVNTENPSLKSVNTHIKTALSLISDRQNPDYRNSIKESISAVESVCKIISNNSKDSLGGALDKIRGKIKLHQSLEKGFKALYGYTSDGDGIRHSLKDESNCDFDDAKFMLISCSAFINYLISKSARHGIPLEIK